MNTIISLKANYEIELKKQQSELLRLNEIVNFTQDDKFRDIEETKSRMFMENSEKVEHLKKSHAQNIIYYEE